MPLLTEQAILLDARVGDQPDSLGTHDPLASPVDSDETLVNTTGAEPTTTQSVLQSTMVSRGHSPTPVPEPRAATPHVPAPGPTVERPVPRPVRATSEPIPRSRFSTVVDRPSRSIPTEPNNALDDIRPLPDSAGDVAITVSTEPVSIQSGRVQNDEEFSRETEAILNEARDLHRRAEDVMRSLETSELPSSPSLPVAEVPREDTPQDISDAAPEVVHDIEPPFLTDGRGRVVWSNAAAGRYRELRRLRSSTAPGPTQQKARRDIADIETVNARNTAEEAADETVVPQRQTSRPRAARAQTSGVAMEGGSWVPVDGA